MSSEDAASRLRAPVTTSVMQKRRKSIFIISFSNIRGDSRVLRQVQYLSPHFDLTVMGHGEPHPLFKDNENVKWLPALSLFPDSSLKGRITKLTNRALVLAGKLFARSYDRLYWSQPAYKDALRKALASGCDAFHANDWNALPIAAEAARRLNARLVFDAHEYAPLEFEEQPLWRFFFAPIIRHILRKYAASADATITVAPAIAERYKREFGLNPLVLMNAPRNVSLAEKKTDANHIRLIHHGCGMKTRQLEKMISTVALCDKRYTLHFMLTGKDHDPDYFRSLRELADDQIPGRFSMIDPVAPDQVVQSISAYDMGFCYIPPSNYSWLVSLPNKFFECIVAGLPVCIGPSPSMAEIVGSYKLGCVAPSFEPQDLAETLNKISAEQLESMRAKAREAAKEINADREMGKLLALYQSLLAEEAPGR